MSRKILFLLLILFLGLTDVQVLPGLLPALQQDFRIRISEVGNVVTVYSLSAGIWALVVGPLSDRLGRMVFIRLALTVFAAAVWLSAQTTEFRLLLVARGMAGFAGGVFSACIIALIADVVPFEKRGRAMGLVAATYSLSAVVGLSGGAFVAGSMGWRTIYWIFFAASLSLLTGSLLSRIDETHRFRSRSGKSPAMPWSAEIRRQMQDYLSFFRRPEPRYGLWTAMLVVAATSSLITYLGAWLAGDFGLSLVKIGWIFLITSLAMITGSLAGGWLSDHIGKKTLFLLCSMGLSALMPLVFLIRSDWHIVLFCMAGGLAISIREGPYQAIITELVTSQQRGAYLALRSTLAKLAIAVSVAIAGFLYQVQGFMAVALFAGFCSAWSILWMQKITVETA